MIIDIKDKLKNTLREQEFTKVHSSGDLKTRRVRIFTLQVLNMVIIIIHSFSVKQIVINLIIVLRKLL